MSTWSEDNFGSDNACDYLTEILYKLVHSINDCLSLPEDSDIFFFGEAKLMPACDILVTLGKAYPYVVVPCLDEKPITEWRDKYLKVFDEKADDFMGANEKQERRQVIAVTFTNLIDLVESY